MEWITDPSHLISLVTLTALEIVLGIDNIIFISILGAKLPTAQQVKARIRIAAESDIRSMSRLDPRRQATFDRARDPIRQPERGRSGRAL